MAIDPNEKYDAARCRVCAHPHDESPRDWGCGYCCPADAPEVPSRSPKTQRRREAATLGYLGAEIVYTNGSRT